jgi:hypothetical protein
MRKETTMKTTTTTTATREQTITRLSLLRQMEQENPCGNGFRFYLDKAIGSHLYYEGAHPTNWQSTPKKLRGQIKQSVGVVELVKSGISDKELGKLIIAEHANTMRDIKEFVMAGLFDEAIAAYDVRFITKEEDSRLKAAEKNGAINGQRYTVAQVLF